MSNEEPAISAHPYQPLHSSNLNETLLAQAVDATPPQTPTKTPHTNQTSHFFSPTSTPRALFPQAHTAHHDVSQMHAILQLQSQMLALSAANSPVAQHQPQRDRDSALLAYQMGERMGALGKMEDAQRDTLQRLQAETTRCASALQDNAADMRAAEVELTHQKETAARLLELVDKHAALIEKLNGTSADVKKELAFRALQQQQTDAANVAERKTLLRSIDECQTKVNSTVQQQAVLEQERKRLTDDVKQLQKLLAATRTELTDSLQQVQLDLQSNNGAHKALKSELASARTTLAELASRQQSDANAVEARFAAQLAQQQRQLSALQADIRTVAATSGAPVGGFYSLLLALAMPFVSPERLVGLVASVGRGFQAIASKRPLRHLWAFALLVDVAMRAGEYRGMLGQRSVPQLWLAPLFSTARGKQALRSARVMRLIFEVVTAIQVVMMVHEASLNAGRRATAALRKSIGRLRSSSPEQTSSDDNNNSSSSGESSNVETPSGGARTTFVKAAVARVFGNRFD